ncbi:pyridoxamine 5'-phosphate oxidase family protein [Parabacteroides pacaensis]|uniref:pyridoxamine 5'-phosphate oxidase family protein n=1 Tax=Parabacteroides pacaensis TaxID=2086575 RepID=UPI000D10EAD3|nr:pyridoxamine 5'-phosphate oxidase family protein [Parabacteroides pacaensis]
MKTLVITEQKEIEAIIAKCDVCFIGLADTDGTPYVLPMNFGYKEGIVYLHSAQEGHSIDILSRNPKICIAFSSDHALVFQHPQVACSYRMRSKSVIGWGNVTYEENFDKKREALDIIMKQYVNKEFTYSDPAIRNVKIWKVKLDKITCKVFGAPHEK